MGAEREVQYECVGSCIIHIDVAHQLTADSDSLVVRSGFRVSGKDSLRHELLLRAVVVVREMYLSGANLVQNISPLRHVPSASYRKDLQRA